MQTFSGKFWFLASIAVFIINTVVAQKSFNMMMGDPFILREGDTYYMYGTTSDDGIEVYKSSDLAQWEGPVGATNGFALHKKDVFGEKWFWAPEVYKIGNQFYMFYSSEEHIAVATSKSPLGPFTQEKQAPLLDSKAIDAHLFIDDNGKKYLYYVAFTNGNVIWMCEMNDDLLSVKPSTVQKCFERSQPWEFSRKEPQGTVNEGPFILKHKKVYYLVYSANHYASQDYGIGYATSKSPKGPWIKYAQNPIWQSPDTLRGVGHCSFFKDKEGNLQMVYHSHFNRYKVQPRRVWINEAEFKKDLTSRKTILSISPSGISPQSFAYFTNPIFDGADPWVIHQDSVYYWCSSTGNGIEISKSYLLTSKGNSKVVWHTPDTGWNRKNIWAPELHFINGKYYVYYAGGREGPPFTWQKAGVLESKTSDPLGEYEDKGMLQTGTDPFNPSTNVWAIDLTVFDHKGKLYAVWSGWQKPEDTDHTSQYLFIAPMNNPFTISGQRVLISKPQESWETGGPLDLNEGPEILKNDSNLFIIYSCRESWLKEYRLGQLRLIHPDSSLLEQKNWIKTGPVFQGTPDVLGTGHASYTTSADGKENWIVYHSKKTEQPGWERDVRIQKFIWLPDGSPFFGEPVPAGKLINRPSGELFLIKKQMHFQQQ